MTNENNPRLEEIKKHLDQVADAAKELRDNGYTAFDQATGAAAKGIAEAQSKALTQLENLKNDQSRIRGENADGWQGFKDDFHNFFAKGRVQHDKNQMERDINKAQKEAERAADQADNALANALDALQASQVAVLDALEASAYAEELKADLTPS